MLLRAIFSAGFLGRFLVFSFSSFFLGVLGENSYPHYSIVSGGGDGGWGITSFPEDFQWFTAPLIIKSNASDSVWNPTRSNVITKKRNKRLSAGKAFWS